MAENNTHIGFCAVKKKCTYCGYTGVFNLYNHHDSCPKCGGTVSRPRVPDMDEEIKKYLRGGQQ